MTFLQAMEFLSENDLEMRAISYLITAAQAKQARQNAALREAQAALRIVRKINSIRPNYDAKIDELSRVSDWYGKHGTGK